MSFKPRWNHSAIAWTTNTYSYNTFSNACVAGRVGGRGSHQHKNACYSLIHRKSFHQNTILRLNRFLFDTNEINYVKNDNDDFEEHTNDDDSPIVTLPKQDYRTMHASKVLGLKNNDTLRAGIVKDGDIISLTNHQHHQSYKKNSSTEKYSGYITDEATIQWIPEGKIKKAEPTKNGDPPGSLQITLHSLFRPEQSNRNIKDYDNDDDNDDDYNRVRAEHDNNNIANTDASSRISLILALPRPLALARLLPMISMMGIQHLILTSAQKVPKDYFGSHLFRNTNEIRKLLIEGLCQAGDVNIPNVTIVNRLKPFLEDDLDDLFPRDEYARVIAHPYRQMKNEFNQTDTIIDSSSISTNCTATEGSNMNDGGPQASNVLRMDDVIFPIRNENSEKSSEKKILLAVGPEGGWAEPFELEMFQSHEFQQITLGSRILRSDVAVISLLSLAHDVCARKSMKATVSD